MKCLLCWGAGVASLLVFAWGGRAFGGVVMAETSFAEGPNGVISSQNKVVYVQGNKEKIEREGVAKITDLDKNRIYIIDKGRRVYTEMPLQPLGSVRSENVHGEASLTKTGKTRIVADHQCDEYRAVGGNRVEHVTISVCVSTDVPGAKEISEFDRNMMVRLGSHKSERSGRSANPGLMLEKQSVLSFSLPDPLQGKPYRTTSLIAKTRVNKIQLASLPPETFRPPVGYSKLENRPHQPAPVDAPDSHPGFEVVMPNQPMPNWLTTST
jgi:hypothetical protein